MQARPLYFVGFFCILALLSFHRTVLSLLTVLKLLLDGSTETQWLFMGPRAGFSHMLRGKLKLQPAGLTHRLGGL